MNFERRIKKYLAGLYIRFCGRPAKLKKAIKVAQNLSKENNGARYRVFFFGCKYHAWNRKQIQEQKHTGLLMYGLKVGSDFDTICFYDTDNPHRYAVPE